jgi:hypothetical protein
LPEASRSQPQGLNLYSFSLNNPLLYYDSDGRQAMGVQDSPENPCRAPQHGWCAQGGDDPDVSITFGEEDVPEQGDAERQEDTDRKGAPATGDESKDDAALDTAVEIVKLNIELQIDIAEIVAEKLGVEGKIARRVKAAGWFMDAIGLWDGTTAKDDIEAAEGARDNFLTIMGNVPNPVVSWTAKAGEWISVVPVARDRHGDWATAPEKVADWIVGRPVDTRFFNANLSEYYRKRLDYPLQLDYPVEYQLD